VDRAGHLLVEEDVVQVARDPVVAAEAELAEPPRARVRLERLDEDVLTCVGGRLDDLAAAEDEPGAPTRPERKSNRISPSAESSTGE